MTRYLSVLPFFAAVALAGIVGATFEPGAWYASPSKPPWTPPNWLFAPVWATLYAMIAVAGWLARQAEGMGGLMSLWTGQLVLNGIWPWLMFSRHGIGEALADIIALWIVVAAFTIRAWPASRSASLLFMPYLAWIGFAAALNFGIWLRNP